MNKNAVLEKIKLNKAGYFECTNYCNTCNSYNCKLFKIATSNAIKNNQTIRG